MDILKMDEEIFRISESPIRAKALLNMAEERFNDVQKETKIYKIIEEYYEIIKEIITSIMYCDGFKTLSHKLLIEYLEKNYNKFFDRGEFILIDELRRLRNDIMYYGKKIDFIFLKNREAQIKNIIRKLLKICKEKIKKEEGR